MEERNFHAENLEVRIYSTRLEMGQAAASVISREIRNLLERNGKASVIFASAPSQNEFLVALREDTSLDWSSITAFHLDEYVGISPRHPASFRCFLIERLFQHVPVRVFHQLNGEAPDMEEECRRYAGLLDENPPGLAILGIGENAHLAFIDPPVCDFQEHARVRLVDLDSVCRQQQINDGCFQTLAEVPTRALTLTIPVLMKVPRAIAIVPGPAKKKAIQAVVEGPISTSCPASILRQHPQATVFLDVDSASLLHR